MESGTFFAYCMYISTHAINPEYHSFPCYNISQYLQKWKLVFKFECFIRVGVKIKFWILFRRNGHCKIQIREENGMPLGKKKNGCSVQPCNFLIILVHHMPHLKKYKKIVSSNKKFRFFVYRLLRRRFRIKKLKLSHGELSMLGPSWAQNFYY